MLPLPQKFLENLFDWCLESQFQFQIFTHINVQPFHVLFYLHASDFSLGSLRCQWFWGIEIHSQALFFLMIFEL